MAVPPYLARSPKPSLDDLSASAGMSRAGTFRRLRPFLLGRPNVVEGLHHYGPSVGWGVRFRQKGKDLCAVVLWPDELFAIITVPQPLFRKALASKEVASSTKENLRAAKRSRGARLLRLSLEDRNLVADFRALVILKGGGPPPRRRP